MVGLDARWLTSPDKRWRPITLDSPRPNAIKRENGHQSVKIVPSASG